MVRTKSPVMFDFPRGTSACQPLKLPAGTYQQESSTISSDSSRRRSSSNGTEQEARGADEAS